MYLEMKTQNPHRNGRLSSEPPAKFSPPWKLIQAQDHELHTPETESASHCKQIIGKLITEKWQF